jgi:hypothetical protein
VKTDAERIARQSAEREEEPRLVPLQKIDKSKWPRRVRPIAIPELDRFGIDDDGLLHWDGKPVEVGRRIDLSWWQNIIAWVVTISIAAGAIGALAQGWVAYHDWACKNNRPSFVTCTPTAPAKPSTPRR